MSLQKIINFIQEIKVVDALNALQSICMIMYCMIVMSAIADSLVLSEFFITILIAVLIMMFGMVVLGVLPRSKDAKYFGDLKLFDAACWVLSAWLGIVVIYALSFGDIFYRDNIDALPPIAFSIVFLTSLISLRLIHTPWFTYIGDTDVRRTS